MQCTVTVEELKITRPSPQEPHPTSIVYIMYGARHAYTIM